MFQCVLKPSKFIIFFLRAKLQKEDDVHFQMPYKIIIQISAGYFSEIHFPRLSYLIEVFQMDDQQTTWSFAHCCFLHLNRTLPPQPLFCLTCSYISFNIHCRSHFLPEAFSSSPCDLPAHLSSLHYKLM